MAPATRVTSTGTFTFYQHAENNCLFTAYKTVESATGGTTPAWYTGVIYGNGSKITIQTLLKWDTDGRGIDPTDYNVPPASLYGKFKFNSKGNKVTEITYEGNVHMGDGFYTGDNISRPHCAESIYTVMIPAP